MLNMICSKKLIVVRILKYVLEGMYQFFFFKKKLRQKLLLSAFVNYYLVKLKANFNQII